MYDVSFDEVLEIVEEFDPVIESDEDLPVLMDNVPTLEDSFDVSFNDVSASDPWLDPIRSASIGSVSGNDYSESLEVISDQLYQIERDLNLIFGFIIICVIFSFAHRLVSRFSFKGKDL